MTDYEGLLAGVQRLIDMGGLQEALELLQKMKQIFPDRTNEIELEILKIMFQQERYEETLNEALEYMSESNADGRIYQWLLEMYYDPFQEESERIYRHNMECLEQYEYFYGSEDKNGIKTLLYDGCEKIIFCGNQSIVGYAGIPEVELQNDEIVLIQNMLNIEVLAEQINKTKYAGGTPDYEVPVYLYYDETIFCALMQCTDIQALLTDHRAVILVGEEGLRTFFYNDQARFPRRLVGDDIGRIKDILDCEWEKKQEKMRVDKMQVEEYYSTAQTDIDERIRQQKPRILFFTSYFTTALQYHTRDMKEAAEKAGLDTELSIEQGSVFSVSEFDFYGVINSFRPDIIFCIDHFRFEYFEYFEIPKEIVWICWIQDSLPHIIDKHTPEKLGFRDFVLNHFTTWKKIADVGYPSERLIDAPITSNQDIYKPYQLTEDELDQYGCDICFVCHASNVDAHIKETVRHLPEELQEIVISIYKGYQSYVYETGELFYEKDMFRDYISGAMSQHCGIKLAENYLDYLADDMHIGFNEKVYRESLVDWILDAGFRNVKLWGNGWKTNPKYTPYAMGAAKNGTTLSKIYQASKIVVGNNGLASAAARAWETMLSGGFYLSNYVPEKIDVVDIRKIIEEGKDLIIFYNKDDLIQKLHYYLDHEDERKIMIEKGRKVALEKMTFDSLFKRMLNEVTTRLQKEDIDR